MPTELPAWALAQRRAVGTRVRELRVVRSLTQEGLAHAIGVDRKTINRVEQATYGSSIDVYVLIARELDCSMEELFRGL
ncbi:helix-turn-helix transcriptional regulator [Kitasatospora sp. NPDC004745]|uniref:helix-turn-helix transcriptional regulator n=1 Tax=Kitasatospora sp. NPDC004745 TaxID=3364019 RepID=UPI0036A56554